MTSSLAVGLRYYHQALVHSVESTLAGQAFSGFVSHPAAQGNISMIFIEYV